MEESLHPPRSSPGKGQARPDSLLSDDVFSGQGCAGHPGHLHVMSDLGEVQTQVHAVDGHSSPSFRWSRHCQNLWEGNGISKPAVHRSRDAPYFFILLPQVFRSLTHSFIQLLKRNEKVLDLKNKTIV